MEEETGEMWTNMFFVCSAPHATSFLLDYRTLKDKMKRCFFNSKLDMKILICMVRYIKCQRLSSQLWYKGPEKPDWEPVEKLSDRDETDSKTKSTDSSKVGDEVQPGHLWRSLELCTFQKYYRILDNNKSTHVLFLEKDLEKKTWLTTTENSWVSKVKIHHGNVFFISVVSWSTLKRIMLLSWRVRFNWFFH